MSRPTSSALRRALARRADAEAGFTLVEVIVALALFAIAAAASIPLLLSASKAGQGAKLNTQAKNLAQQRVEAIRNLPLYVATKNGPYVDVLDQYYRNLSAATGTTVANAASGYVAPSSTARLTGEPASGAYYRYVVPNDGSAATKGFTQVVASQFLDSRRQPVTPAATFNSQSPDGFDLPPSQLLGVTVITAWSKFGVSRQFKLYTEISDAKPAATQTGSQARASAVRVTSTVDGSQVTNEVGIVNAQGALTTGSTASVIAQGALMFVSPGDQVKGAEAVLAAPPNVSPGSVSTGAKYLSATGNDCTLACVGKTTVSNAVATVDFGLPNVGSAAAPVTASVVKENVGIRFSNKPDNPKLAFLDAEPLIRTTSPSNSGDLATGSAYLTTTQGAGHSVVAGTAASTQTVKLFHTKWTPVDRGVVEITLTKAALDCTSSTAGGTAAADFSATVQYWDWDLQAYVTLGEVRDGGSDVLGAVDLTTIRVGPDTFLSDYVSGWTNLTGASTTTEGKAVSATLDGVVSVTTAPTRDGDPTSAISVKLGTLSCYAEDNRS